MRIRIEYNPTKGVTIMGIYRCPLNRSITGNSLFGFRQILKWLLILLVQFNLIMILCTMLFAGEQEMINRAKVDLRTWKIALDMYYVDWIKYPEGNSIEEIARLLESSGYWEKPMVKDPWGNLYQYSANADVVQLRSLGEDGIVSIDDITIQTSLKTSQTESLPIKENAIARSYPAKYNPVILNPGTIITLSKSGNNVLIAWTEVPSQTYDIVRATDKQFFNAVTLALDLIGNSYTYTNGLINNRNIEFFDVTDDTETNRGSDNNGGDPPPQPPVITVSPIGLYIGSSATVNGTGFSLVKDDNSIWFSGGVKANVSNATATQIDFVVPVGAVSGNYNVTIGGALTSEPISAPVFLDDSTQTWTTARTIGYSEIAGSYWGGGNWGGNRLVEMKYNNSTGKWEKSNKTGTDPNFVNTFLYCSTKTDSNGRIFCGKANLLISAARTAYADTVSESTLQPCRILSPDGEKQQHVIGAAADPDPNRNVAYFAYSYIDPDTSIIYNYIYKVQSDCSSIIDNNYGNTDGTDFNFPSIVGMAVDKDGVLYISEGSQITRIWQDEYGEHYEVLKSGFNNLLGIDVKQASPGGPVFIIGAEFGADRIIAFSTDNASTPVDIIPSGSGINARTVAWSQTVFDEWIDIKRKRNTFVYNRGNSVISIEGDYRLIVEPVTMEDGRAWISSPVALDMPPYQTQVRASDPTAIGYSTIVARAWWRDGIARQLCAYSGDPRSSAPYEPAPADTTLCDRPRDIAGAICDNKEDFSSTGPGSFVINNSYNYCFPLGCGTDENNACEIELRISQRYAGDNYKVYFKIQDEVAQQTIAQATGNLTAWKHAHIEKDKMFRKGGLLSESFDPLLCFPNCNQIKVWQWTNIDLLNSTIAIFDSENTFEAANNEQRIIIGGSSNPDGTFTLILNFDLQKAYIMSPYPDFSSGNSAGIGQLIDANGIPCQLTDGNPNNACFFETDTSDLKQAFNDGFISFHIPMQIENGAGIVSYLPKAWFDAEIIDNLARFSQRWFKKFINAGGDPPLDEEHNYFHLISASEKLTSDGFSMDAYDFSYIMAKNYESLCPGSPSICIRNGIAHEIAHQYIVNACTDLIDCTNPDRHLKKHDYRGWWLYGGIDCNSPNVCMMHPEGGNLTDGIDRLCKEDLLLGDPNCTDNPKSGAIRTTIDPK